MLLYVIVPQSWPAILAVGLFHFFWAWNDFFEPLVYLQGKESLYPLSVGLTQFANTFSTRPDLLMAASLMTVAVPYRRLLPGPEGIHARRRHHRRR